MQYLSMDRGEAVKVLATIKPSSISVLSSSRNSIGGKGGRVFILSRCSRAAMAGENLAFFLNAKINDIANE
jgi:hypothetical protein